MDLPRATTGLLLDARGLVKSLGEKRVVDGVDLTCAPGEVLGLLGPNGAGKTTSLRMCYGFLRPDAGTIHIAGHDLTLAPDAARQALGVCTQDDTFDADFSVRGNLEQTGRYYRPRIPDLQRRIDELLDQFGLKEYEHHMPEMLSGGYKRRLMIARAVLHRPKVAFLDEPTTGLDPQARVAVWELVASLRSQGMAVVLTTHYMDEAERLSDRLLVLQSGKVRSSGLARSVLGDVVGEHIVVLPVNTPGAEGIPVWLAERKLITSTVLGCWHIPLDVAGLAAFVAAFPKLRYEVRIPTLDDLFLALADEKKS
ncbi:MAG TPA: ABC transporter ATP-binding protein [Planctomycetota bacterium]|jgi:lipooligosaccharide transport system ATP-binding protein|nr:ABC transporter ATP-binding protein [Planctomycetota bacterium]